MGARRRLEFSSERAEIFELCRSANQWAAARDLSVNHPLDRTGKRGGEDAEKRQRFATRCLPACLFSLLPSCGLLSERDDHRRELWFAQHMQQTAVRLGHPARRDDRAAAALNHRLLAPSSGGHSGTYFDVAMCGHF